MQIRALAIKNFSKDNIPSDQPYSVLEDVFVPLYFFHRYQTEATVKLVGGLDYNYALKDDGQTLVQPVPAAQQKEAFKALLATIAPENLMIPKDKLALFPPRAFGYPRTRESFKSDMGVAFDALNMAETASKFTLSLLLHPERANRMVQQHALDENQMDLQSLVRELLEQTIKKNYDDSYQQEIQKLVNWQVLYALMHLASNDKSLPQVTEIIAFEMMRLKTYFEGNGKRVDPTFILMKKEVEGFIGNPFGFKKEINVPKIPDGSPIGMPSCSYSDHD